MITTPCETPSWPIQFLPDPCQALLVHCCLLTDAGNLPTKMALLNLCFKEIFLGKVARLVLRRCLRGNGTTLNGVEKNHPDLFGMTDDGMVTFFAEFVCCLAFSGGSRTKCPTTTKCPGSLDGSGEVATCPQAYEDN